MVLWAAPGALSWHIGTVPPGTPGGIVGAGVAVGVAVGVGPGVPVGPGVAVGVGAGVAVGDVRPGRGDTQLTYGLPGLVLVAQPKTVAADAWKGIRRGRAVVYTPWFWRAIMEVIRLLPHFVFRRLPL